MNDNQGVKDRLKIFISSKGIAINHFEKLISVSNGYVNSISKSIGGTILERISKIYPELNREWLLTGKGDRENSKPRNTVKAIEPLDEETIVTKSGMQFIPNRDGSYTMLTPHITEYAYGGYLKGFSDDKYISELPPFPVRETQVRQGIYRSFTVIGDSMDNGLKGCLSDGDIVTGRLIQRHLWKDRLHIKYNKFFIIHHNNGLIVKSIIDHDVEKSTITIHSLNPDRESYPDETLSLNDVKELYNVIFRAEKM